MGEKKRLKVSTVRVGHHGRHLLLWRAAGHQTAFLSLRGERRDSLRQATAAHLPDHG